MPSTIEIALSLAAQGFPVFPCSFRKSPSISKAEGGRGFLDATADAPEVIALFGRAPDAGLVGVPTGAVSGFDVLDVDPRHGGDKWLAEYAARLPVTRVHSTQSGGSHYLFRHATGVRNSAGKATLANGIDIRGDGGYVIFPPSIGYTVTVPGEPADWPDWLLQIVLARKIPDDRPDPPPTAPSELSSARLQKFRDALVRRVRDAPDGAKHATLRNAALSLGGILHMAPMTASDAVNMLVHALPQSVENWEQARRTAEWGVTEGMRHPIELPDRPEYQPRYSAPPKNPGTEPLPETSLEPLETSLNLPAVADPSAAARLPTIRVWAGLKHQAADEAIEAMRLANIPFYQRNRQLVRIVSHKIKTAKGDAVELAEITPVVMPYLARAMGQSAEWERVNKNGEPIRVDPPKDVVDQVLSMPGHWTFPPITGVISTPTMRPDGTIFDAPGYDGATGLVLVAPPPMRRVPDHPSRLDADVAIDQLQRLLTEFPFADDVSRSVAISMILTTVRRGALSPAVPMHVATAPAPGTGKSYLMDIASAISLGTRCAAITQSPNPEETEKRLHSLALSGRSIVAIDNVTEALGGAALNAMISQDAVTIRRLGGSDETTVPNAFTVFANGNNLSAPADLVRRTLVCRLDAGMESPEKRLFASDPVETVLADRGYYVAAALTIGRAYVAAGSPGQLDPLPSFKSWSNLVRSAIVWLGMPDPCLSMDAAKVDDPFHAAKVGVFHAWQSELGLRIAGLTTRRLIELANEVDEHGFRHPLFREACLDVAGERNDTDISSRRLGRWLEKNTNNVIGQMRLLCDRSDAARPKWLLQRMDG